LQAALAPPADARRPVRSRPRALAFSGLFGMDAPSSRPARSPQRRSPDADASASQDRRAGRSGPHERSHGRRRTPQVYEPAPFVRKVEGHIQAGAGSVLSGKWLAKETIWES
jgi:hypothetical protein